MAKAIARIQPIEVNFKLTIDIPVIVDPDRPEECTDAVMKMAKVKILEKLEQLSYEVTQSFLTGEDIHHVPK